MKTFITVTSNGKVMVINTASIRMIFAATNGTAVIALTRVAGQLTDIHTEETCEEIISKLAAAGLI